MLARCQLALKTELCTKAENRCQRIIWRVVVWGCKILTTQKPYLGLCVAPLDMPSGNLKITGQSANPTETECRYI